MAHPKILWHLRKTQVAFFFSGLASYQGDCHGLCNYLHKVWDRHSRVLAKVGLKIWAHVFERRSQKARERATRNAPVCIYIPRTISVHLYTYILYVYARTVTIYIPSVHPYSYSLCRDAHKKISRVIGKTSAPFAMVIIDWFIQCLMEIA